MELINKFLEFELLNIGTYHLKVSTLFLVLLIVIITKVVLIVIKQSIFRNRNLDKFDEGNVSSLYQIIKYIIWIIAFGFILETFGIKISILLAGSAALLVGVGLGLQQTFNDVISGVILLSERSIKIGDVLEIDGNILKIQEIGLRTSKGLNTDDISTIIPNSLITTNKVINWSHQTRQNRFRIEVGTSYGSDVELVIRILEESAKIHPEVDDTKFIEARLVNFGNSSLDFQVLFYSSTIFGADRMKSDIRRTINQKFIENNVTIPFPQLDVHIK
ncbi:mechanosensitive ion channel family protein [Polaribacter glomeratus]|uniref:Mechanosensitive ion channel protein MscS n=1 Tax=Polaribacter glomeratus TaxID=102 RepID=A0A2S7WXP6_9FLAO|nr:mechanosensitive ion channel domain-containing protein [Polaribacter glomeratus]PQJ82266.1 mechanosensitive ion channel protein MscS [Polaribacter glomeratus]TXD66861.1 mechanosensitive ion channel [Polaribacter glomeratus]